MLGGQFNYLGNIATKFMALGENSDEDSTDWNDAEEEGGGWNDDDVEFEDEDEETNLAEAPTVGRSLSEVNEDDSAPPRSNEEQPVEQPLVDETTTTELPTGAITPPPSTGNPLVGSYTPGSVDAGILSDHRAVAGRLDAVIQQIDEQEQKNHYDNDGESFHAAEMSLSDQEHQDIAVQEIQHEMEQLVVDPSEQLVDQTPAVTMTGNDDDTARAADGASRLAENEDDEQEYGPVVDHLPQKPLPMERHDSMAVQMILDEDASGWKEDEEDTLEEPQEGLPPSPQTPPEPTVVDHTPVAMEPDDTALSVLVAASVADDAEAFGLVVDHTPPTPAPSNILAESMAVNASEIEKDFEDDEEMDFTSNGDSAIENGWDEDDDQADAATVTTEGKRTTFAPDVFTHDNPALVDHLPSEMPDEERAPYDNSVIALATTEDMTRDTNMDEEDDENEDDYGPVVDQTPEPPAYSGVNSCAAHAASEGDSIGDDETDAAGVGGWGNEEEEGKEDDVAVVDHTPSQIESSTKRADIGSVLVLASRGTVEASITDENEEAIVYGPVVDHTPATPAPAGYARSESIVAQANDDLGTVDETTVREPADDDQSLRNDETVDDGDQVVDFIPTGQESLNGDGSTLAAAADPSEVLSVVDGLAPEDQNFGPVVDVTPHPSARQVPVGEGSTAVFASPSVVVDDLDPEEDGVVEQDSWDNGAAPNPQCGIDEPVEEENEQLVDFLPPPNILNADPDVTREGLSDFTIGGAQSFSMQGENPREDDFGPVVDQIPFSGISSHISVSSTATQLTPSECKAIQKDDAENGKADESIPLRSDVVVDHLPSLEGKNPMDSVATHYRSLLSEEEEEEEVEEDATKFGPVVDHLPTSRASVAPSRGGSTVDALATVSEVRSDEEGSTPGWPDEDEIDFDASLGGLSDVTEQAASRPKPIRAQAPDPDRNVSVRFDSSVTDLKCAPDGASERKPSSTPDEDESEFQDPDDAWHDDSLMKDLSSTNFHDAEQNFIDKSFSEADTPPSTPHRRSIDLGLAIDNGISLPKMGIADGEEKFENGEEKSAPNAECNDASLLSPHEEAGLVLGEVITPNGGVVKIDLSKVLRDEITRRRLAEEELKALKNSDGPKTEELLAEVASLEREKEASQSEMCEARLQREKVLRENEDLKKSLGELQDAKSDSQAKEAAFEAEVSKLRESLEEAVKSGESSPDERSMLTKVQVELAAKEGECKELASRLADVENRLREAEQRNAVQAHESADTALLVMQGVASLTEQKAGDKLIEHSAQVNRELKRRIKALESELENVRASGKEVAELQIKHEIDLQEQYKLLDRKTTDIQTLDKMVASLQKEKAAIMSDLTVQRSLAEQSETLANELLLVAKERDFLERSLRESSEAMSELQKLIDEQSDEREELAEKRKAENSSLRSELETLKNQLSTKQQEVGDLISQVDFLQREREELESNAALQRNSLEEEIEVMKDVAMLEKQKLDSTKVELRQVQQKLEAQEFASAAAVEQLQSTISSLELKSSDSNSRIEELEAQKVALEEKSAAFETERKSLLISRDEASALVQEIDGKYKESLAAFETKERELQITYNEDIEKVRAKSKGLEEEIAKLLEAERLNAQTLEEVERSAIEEAQQFCERNAQLNAECAEHQEEIRRLNDLVTRHGGSIRDMEKESKSQIEKLTQELILARENQSSSLQPLSDMKIELERKEEEHLNKMKTLEKLNESLRAETVSFQDSTKETNAKLERMAEERAEVDRELAHHKTEADRLRLLCTRLQEEATTFEETKFEQSRSLADLESRLQETLLTQDERLSVLRTAHEETQAELRMESEKLKLANEKGKEAQKNYEVSKDENEEILVQFGLLKHELDESDARSKSLTAQNAELMAENAELKAENGGVNDSLKSELNRLRETNESTTSALEGVENRLSEALKENVGLKDTMKILEDHASELDQQREKLLVELKSLEHSQTETGKIKLELSETTEHLREKDKLLSEAWTETTEAKERLEEQNKRVEEIRGQLQEKDEQHTKSLQYSARRLEELEDQLKKAEEERQSAQSSFAANSEVLGLQKETEMRLESDLQAKNSSIAALQDNVLTLETNLESRTRELDYLRPLKDQVDVLNEALTATRNRLSAKESEIDRLSVDIRELQATKSQDALQIASRELSQTLPKADEGIISRAAQLRRSESGRMSSLKRLEDERRANVEAIEKLRASVNRYCNSSEQVQI